MKKVKILLAVVLVSASVLALNSINSYADSTKANLNVTVKEKEPEKGIISLGGNASTGYGWLYSIKDSSLVDIQKEKSIPYDPTGRNCGSGETNIWSIKGLKEGTTQVTFYYLKQGEDKIQKRVTYDIKIDSKLNVKVYETKPIQNEKDIIVLYAKTPEGYEWEYSIKDDSIASLPEEDKIINFNNPYGQTQIWRAKGLKEGTTEVTYKYHDLKTKEIEKVITYEINVDSDLNATVKEKSREVQPSKGRICLTCDESTGCEWQYRLNDESIAEIKERDKRAIGHGTGQVQEWSVKGLKKGYTTAVFTYSKPGTDEIEKTALYFIQVDEKLNTSSYERTSTEGQVSLHSNKNEGYDWKYKVNDKSLVKVKEAKCEPDNKGGETQNWFIKGLKQGTTEITFNYAKAGASVVDKSVTYIIDVDSDLNVKVTKKNLPKKSEKESMTENNLKIPVKVEEDKKVVSSHINPTISFENTTSKPLDLSKVTLKYYYTADDSAAETFKCYYAGKTNGVCDDLTSFVRGDIKKITPDETKNNADTCLEIKFSQGVLEPGQSVSMNVGVHKNNWTQYNRNNDYSYNNANGVELSVAE